MEDTLLDAIRLLLDQIDQTEVVKDLLLIEVDWGSLLESPTDEICAIPFQATSWMLVYTQSELVLRKALSQANNSHVILVYHAGSGFQLPMDIRARAHTKTPYRLGLRHRLVAITHCEWPPEVDYLDWRPSVLAHLDDLIRLSGGTETRYWAITRSDLEQLLIQVSFGLKVQGQTPQKILAELVAIQRRHPKPPEDLMLTLLQEQLRQHAVEKSEATDFVAAMNFIAMIVWAAEKPGRAEEVVRTGLMMAAEQAVNLMPNWAGLNPLRARLVTERKNSENQAVAMVSELAIGALAALHPSTRQSILKVAQNDLANVLPAEAYNPWFPALLEKESLRLAERLAVRDVEAIALVKRLDEHFSASDYRNRLDALGEMADLVSRWQSQFEAVKSNSSAAAWARWYAGQGARLDLSALRLMNAAGLGAGLEKPIQNLLQSYWNWRDQCNARFAAEYLAGYEAAVHDRDAGIYGVQRLLTWNVRPLLQTKQRVLLIVLDSMSYPDYYQLVEQWSKKIPAVYGHPVGPTLSLLPSVTSVSRKALFLNALPTDRLDDDETYEKKAAISEGKALQEAFPDKRVRLYNKTNWDDQQIFNDLQFHQVDVLAVIINTIDDDLKNATTSVRLPTLEDLGSLVQIVRKGIESGWPVLLTSDHGHTWHRDKRLRRGEAQAGGDKERRAGERFIFLTRNQISPIDAIVTSDPHIVVDKNQRLALLTATGSYFGHNPRRGYHGGASLEEVVLPCIRLMQNAPAADETGESAARVAPPKSSEAGYDLNGVVITLSDRRMVTLTLPFTLTPIEVKLLQALAHFGEASEAQLKQSVGSRRISGPLSNLLDRLAAAGFDLVEYKGEGSDGAVYRFRAELLK